MADQEKVSPERVSQERVSTTNTQANKIKAIGPSDEYNQAEILRFQPNESRKKPIDIRSGQILTIGEEITSEEAETLLNMSIWDFERVTDNG